MSRRDDNRVGFVDYCRIDDRGKVRCYEDSSLTAVNRAPKEVPLDASGGEGAGKKKAPDKKGHPWGGKQGSPMFTSTTKVHAPSWSMPMGLTCPVIRTPVLALVNDMYENAKKRGKRITKQQAVSRLLEKIPEKCLACYGMTGNYPYEQSQTAMSRRVNWFNHTKDDDVVKTLVAAISKAGDEHCKRSTGECTYTPMVPPSHFRLFDSGDFTTARDVRIWYRVAKHFDGKNGRPLVKFWAPTTAWAAPCEPGVREKKEHQALMRELRKLSKLPHVTVRPSEVAIDRPPVRVKGLGAGTSVVEQEYADRHGGKPRGTMKVCETNADGKQVNCQKAYVCPGNCGACKVCWTKKVPVVYVRHGLKPEPRNVLEIINRTVGTMVPEGSLTPERYRKANQLFQRQFVSAADVGPWGGDFEEGKFRLPKFLTRSREEIRELKRKALERKLERQQARRLKEEG